MIGCCLAFVILLVLTYSLYKEKRMYEQYLTMNVRQDIVELKSAIIHNDLIFNRILENGKIINEMVEDGEQARQLQYNLIDMSQIINKYNLMNLSFSQETSWLVTCTTIHQSFGAGGHMAKYIIPNADDVPAVESNQLSCIR
jgi:hypothetical protein